VERIGRLINDFQYLTVLTPVDYETTISRSHFVASLRFASSRDEFDAELKKITELFPKATHYCWAYRFTGSPPVEHASDAGEPAGTAGRPILGSLKKYSLLNTAAVVTRFYGGVKLGVKGLISAYGETVREAISIAEIVAREPMTALQFSCSYDLYNIFLSMMQKFQIDVASSSSIFNEDISGEILIPTSKLHHIKNELEKLRERGSSFRYSL